MADRVSLPDNGEPISLAGSADRAGVNDRRDNVGAEIDRIAARFCASPVFLSNIKHLSAELTALYDVNPRLGKLLGSHRRWFMTQVGYAIHASHASGDARDALTASRIVAVMEKTGVASRNTVASFVAEMVAYHYLVAVPGTAERRSRPLMPTDIAVSAMNTWLMTNMVAMDRIDTGTRAAVLSARPELFAQVQATTVKLLLNTPEWLTPDNEIMNFLSAESGGLVLDALISVIDLKTAENGILALGRINISKMAKRFRVSRANLDRVLKRAEELGSIGRHPDGGSFMSEQLFTSQARRQALKFAVLDHALRHALNHPGEPVRFS